MAEKYGTVPKKFTKAWWEYFWTYYKWHTIIILFIVVAIGGTIYGNITEEKFDLTLTYAGSNMYTEEISENLTEVVSPLCKDVDQNGEPNINFSQLNVVDNQSDPEYTMAMTMKLQMCFAEDDTYLFILDKDVAEAYAGDSADECAYAPLDDWLTEDIPDEAAFTAHGRKYGVKLSECKLFKDIGMDVSDQYMVMRYYPRKDQIEKQLAGYEAAVDLANKILSE